MKKLVLLSVMLLTAGSVLANEPLLLTPLSPASLSTTPAVNTTVNNGVQVTTPGTTTSN